MWSQSIVVIMKIDKLPVFTGISGFTDISTSGHGPIDSKCLFMTQGKIWCRNNIGNMSAKTHFRSISGLDFRPEIETMTTQ